MYALGEIAFDYSSSLAEFRNAMDALCDELGYEVFELRTIARLYSYYKPEMNGQPNPEYMVEFI